jgi:iron complex transport system substrate-binding protein
MRIVSLLPSTTEIVYALGLGNQLVGVTHECDYPADALHKPKLTRSHIVAEARGDETVAASIDGQVRESLHAGHSLYDIDAELLAQLWPDLILTQELCDVCAVSSALLRATLARLALSPQILSLEPTSLDAVYQTILDVGDATETSDRARVEVDQLRTRAAKLGEQTKGRPAPRTLVLEWTDPPMGSGHWTPALVEIAGGTPVLGWTGEYSRVISWDEIRSADPECIIVAPCGMDLVATRASIDDLTRTNDAWRSLVAGGKRRVVAMDGNQFANRPGPRLIETAELFAAAIHPELFASYVRAAMKAAKLSAVDYAAVS